MPRTRFLTGKALKRKKNHRRIPKYPENDANAPVSIDTSDSEFDEDSAEAATKNLRMRNRKRSSQRMRAEGHRTRMSVVRKKKRLLSVPLCEEDATEKTLPTDMITALLTLPYSDNTGNVIGTRKGRLLDWIRCPRCEAEILNTEAKGSCCGNGSKKPQLVIAMPPVPDDLLRLCLTNRDFVRDARKFNNLFALSALGTTNGFHRQNGPCNLVLQGKTYHRMLNGNFFPIYALSNLCCHF